MDHAHELAHHVAVEPRRAKRVLSNHPARRKDGKVRKRLARRVRRARQHGEDRGVGVVEGHRTLRGAAQEARGAVMCSNQT